VSDRSLPLNQRRAEVRVPVSRSDRWYYARCLTTGETLTSTDLDEVLRRIARSYLDEATPAWRITVRRVVN
jgi:hypothetical protein